MMSFQQLGRSQVPINPAITAAAGSPIAPLCAFVAREFAAEFAGGIGQMIATLESDCESAVCSTADDTSRNAIHVLSGRRDALQAIIQANVCRRFNIKLDSSLDWASPTGQFSRDALMLLNELGMQQEFDIENAVEQVRSFCQPELDALTQRVQEILGWTAIPESRNPVFPRVLLRALMDALEAIDCNPRTRIAVLGAAGPLLDGIFTRVYSRACANCDCEESGQLRCMGYEGFQPAA